MPITFVARHRIIPVALAAAFVVGATAARTPNTRLPRAAALDDPTIVAIFDAANTWDVETGALAEKKGTTKDVREFGAMLVHDHTMVRQQGRDLASKLGVHPTPPNDFAMAKDHEAAMKTLRAAKGVEFDRAFLQHEVAYHKAVIDDRDADAFAGDPESGAQGSRREGRAGTPGAHGRRAAEARRAEEHSEPLGYCHPERSEGSAVRHSERG